MRGAGSILDKKLRKKMLVIRISKPTFDENDNGALSMN